MCALWGYGAAWQTAPKQTNVHNNLRGKCLYPWQMDPRCIEQASPSAKIDCNVIASRLSLNHARGDWTNHIQNGMSKVVPVHETKRINLGPRFLIEVLRPS